MFLASVLVFFAGCGIKEQADQLQALEKCTYEIVAADSVYVAGTNVNKLIENGRLNLLEAPRIAFAYLSQQIPVKAILQFKITNEGPEEAGINQFEYKVLIKDTELLSGFIDQKVTVAPNGGSTIIPVKIDKDIYPLISNTANQQTVTDFLDTRTEKSMIVTFMIKPRFEVGTQVIEYPDFIKIDKELTNTTLLSYIRNK